jgi:hypothetical protein
MDALIWKECGCCSRLFQPQREAQRWCCPACRAEGKAAEQRSARELWRRQGRPMLDEPRREQIDREQIMRDVRARLNIQAPDEQPRRKAA